MKLSGAGFAWARPALSILRGFGLWYVRHLGYPFTILVTLVMLDAVLTVIARGRGASELNPLFTVAPLLPVMFVAKVVGMASVAAISRSVSQNLARSMFTVMSLLYAALCGWNGAIIVILGGTQ